MTGKAKSPASRLVARLRHRLRQAKAQRKKRQQRQLKSRIHAALTKALQQKDRLKVGFVVIHDSSWKLQHLLDRMCEIDGIEPFVYVPRMNHGDPAVRIETQSQTVCFFQAQSGPFQVSTDINAMRDFDPDLYFMTNPHELVAPESYSEIFENKLCCYVPYTADVVHYGDDQAQYNQPFHHWMWRIFAPHEVSRKKYETVSNLGDENVVVTGYPGFETLLNPREANTPVWKPQSRPKKKIIWAPHHTVNRPELPLSNFLIYFEYFKDLALRHKDQVAWAFKPHPVLKSALADPEIWGPEKTERYYSFWRDQDNTQLEQGSYAELFLQSDAMIHDSVSFLAEYHVVGKPVLFLDRVGSSADFLNDFGKRAHAASELAYTQDTIDEFILSVMEGSATLRPDARTFVEQEVLTYTDPFPTDRILEEVLTLTPKLAAKINRQN